MAIELTNQVCVITGAGEGVGHGLVLGFSRRGARVAACVLNRDDSVALPAETRCFKLDVTKNEDVQTAVESIVAHYGRIDVWINNAGIYPRKAADEMTFADWREVLDVNLDGAWRCCEAIIPHMKRQKSGVILNIGSIVVRLGSPRLTHYLASKAGVVGMTRGLARDLGPFGIRVNCVHLGAVRTEGERRLFPDEDALLKSIEEKQALSGRLTPDTVEPVFAFLASDDSRDITGQCVAVDRGWSHE